MKLFNSSQRVITMLLISLLLVSISFIIHLEIKAANLATKWEEHEKSLLKNEDVLENLSTFIRRVNNSNLVVMNDISLNTENSINLSSGKNFNFNGLILDANQEIVALNCGDFSNFIMGKDHIIIESSNTQVVSRLALTRGGAELKVDGDLKIGPSKDKYIGYNAKEDRFYIHHSGASISDLYVDLNGISLLSGHTQIRVNEREIRLLSEHNQELFEIKLDPINQFLGLTHGNSFLGMEKGNIKIDTHGDINITSTNGNVNIKGKKVSLNE